jgi:hypothetical protein
MPLRGGLRLSVIALTLGGSLVAAGAASANDVTLWACHGPGGEALGAAPFQANGANPDIYGVGCDQNAATPAAGGLDATLPSTAGAANKSLTAALPLNVTLSSVTLTRRTNGFDQTEVPPAGGKQHYTASVDGTALESATLGTDAPLTFAPAFTKAAAGRTLSLTVSCDATPSNSCGGNPVGVDLAKAALNVTDSNPPTAAVGGVGSDASGTMKIAVWATDVGLGLDRAEAWVDGQKAAIGYYGGTDCQDLTPGDAHVDLPLGASCPLSGRLNINNDPAHDPTPDTSLKIDTNAYADGQHKLTVLLFDAAQNQTTLVNNQTFTITNHATTCGNPCLQALNIGSGSTPQQNGSSNNNGGGTGGVAGASAVSCSSPRLSMELSQKPLRVSGNSPVLKSGKRYRFRGRLTCIVNKKRVSAPRFARIDLLNVIGKRTVTKGGTAVRTRGRITIILAYKSSRTLIFRYTNPDGKRSQVKIKIKVAKQ